MISILSLVTSIKDYVEVLHKLIESDSSFKITNYDEFGPVITYILITLKDFIFYFFSLNWLKTIWDLPIIIPDINSAMLSEISVLDGYFHNAFNFLDTPLWYGDKNLLFSTLEKFSIGLINSLFLFLPTGTAHLITLRRFVMQGLEAGYISGLGTICGSILWITSVIFGWRFFVIPWLSLDIFRYLLGFILLVKYMWNSYNEKKQVIPTQTGNQKMFLLNFLLALTEQTSVYPFISNMSIGPESSVLESFPASSFSEFLMIHSGYILGLTLGCLSLLHFTCWFWENPAFKIYMWTISSFKVSTTFYYKALNFTFLYLTMICAITSIPYYGLDYTLTNPLGLVQDDRILDQKLILETSFLNTKASDRNTRRNRGRHGRRERWKRRIRKYRTFDASLYDQGVYDLFTIEDLNYGFDRFWLRRKMRNHRVRFRFFPGPWMRSFKKQLAKPRLESYAGPRQEFFRILFEQVYHPSFHEYLNKGKQNKNAQYVSSADKQKGFEEKGSNSWNTASMIAINNSDKSLKKDQSIYFNNLGTGGLNYKIKKDLKIENSTLRKFVRKTNMRIKSLEIKTNLNNSVPNSEGLLLKKSNLLYSKRWKQIFSKLSGNAEKTSMIKGQLKGLFGNFYQTSMGKPNSGSANLSSTLREGTGLSEKQSLNVKKQSSQIPISKKDQQILKYRSLFLKNKVENNNNAVTLLHPLKFYLQKQQAFERKLRYYTPTIFRKFSIENNAPYFRVMMKRYFYYFKPTLRWERTMKVASLRKARRKTPVSPRKIQFTETSLKQLPTSLDKPTDLSYNPSKREVKATHNYTIVGKRASRYRYQIYKDVLQHWYYSPFNRLLLKFDIDLFIKRQPNSHFLTKNEENLLHLRRFLLSEHYNSLRWYTYMQHYRSMKTKIGGTKSFASGVYNQQFTGTFKKIRHLFAITPSQGNQTVLKFDQPLYNEYSNTLTNNYQKNLIIHEELLNPETELTNNGEKIAKDLLNQSIEVIGNYLIKTNPIKQEYIKNLLDQKNYVELTQFLYKGQKTRGSKPVTNEKTFLAQESQYLLTQTEQEELKNLEKVKLEKLLRPFQDELWVNLLKKWKRKINDQEFLKNYLQRRIEKREKRKQKSEKNLKTKMQRLKNLLPEDSLNSQSLILPLTQGNTSTGVQKALIEGVSTLDTNFDKNTLKLNQRNSFANSLNWNPNKELNEKDSKVKQKNLKEASLLKKETELHDSLNNLSKILKETNKETKKNLFNSENFVVKPVKVSKVTTTLNTIYLKYVKSTKTFLTKKLFGIFKQKNTLKNWQKTERALSKQKRVRKEFKAFSKKPFKNDSKMYLKYLDQTSDIPLKNSSTEPSRKKRDSINNDSLEIDQTIKNKIPFTNYFMKKFKRKKSPQRRARVRRNRGVTKKRTLSDSLKRQFKNLRKYNISSTGEKIDNKKEKIYLNFNAALNKELNEDGIFKTGPLQRRSKQKKQRYWKQKRSKYSQKLRKYRKRRHSVLTKIRILNKQLKRIKLTTDLKNWWWKNFLPNLRATTDSLLQYEKDRQIQQKLLELSIPEILERNTVLNNQGGLTNSLQIGDFDFKPLAMPEAIKTRENLLKDKNLIFENQNSIIAKSTSADNPLLGGVSKNDILSRTIETSLATNRNTPNQLQNNKVVPTNPIPFYAGWDESLRKFVITNRLLSRRDSGYEMQMQQQNQSDFKSLLNSPENENILAFSDAPLKGMNAATTLYWQIPFTTYDPDQFFALGMDGFAPLGWRRFQFRHSILKSWLYEKTTPFTLNNSKKTPSGFVVKNKITILKNNPKDSVINQNNQKPISNSELVYKLNLKLNPMNSFSNVGENKNMKNIYRRLKKRYRRVKKHPRSPVWFPAGPLLNQVLPVHYIYIFYKRSRLPRERYIKRRLRKSKATTSLAANNMQNRQIPDFTLRKRVKTKRKYHIKQNSTKKLPIIPRRMKFIGENPLELRWRPLSRQKLNKPIAELIKEQRLLKSKQRKKENQDLNSKQAPNLRIKQLRRRVQRQIIRSVWRYKPRAGGFVWPGDYLKLELVKAPKMSSKLNTSELNDTNKLRSTSAKVKRKKKRTIQEWQIQPKKYLLEKHNYTVIKKKLEKAQRSHKVYERVKELNFII